MIRGAFKHHLKDTGGRGLWKELLLRVTCGTSRDRCGVALTEAPAPPYAVPGKESCCGAERLWKPRQQPRGLWVNTEGGFVSARLQLCPSGPCCLRRGSHVCPMKGLPSSSAKQNLRPPGAGREEARVRVRLCVSYQPCLHGRLPGLENDLTPRFSLGEKSFLNLGNNGNSFLFFIIIHSKVGSDLCE